MQLNVQNSYWYLGTRVASQLYICPVDIAGNCVWRWRTKSICGSSLFTVGVGKNAEKLIYFFKALEYPRLFSLVDAWHAFIHLLKVLVQICCLQADNISPQHALAFTVWQESSET